MDRRVLLRSDRGSSACHDTAWRRDPVVEDVLAYRGGARRGAPTVVRVGVEDPTTQVLRLLEQRPTSASYLAKKVADAPKVLRSLLKKQFIEMEDVQADRDPLRSSSARLRVQHPGSWPEGKLKKAEREVLSYLELHPGSHNLAEVDAVVKGASAAVRALARRRVLTLTMEPAAGPSYPFKERPD